MRYAAYVSNAQSFPRAYIDAIAAVPCRKDPDVGRRDVNNRIIETIRRHSSP